MRLKFVSLRNSVSISNDSLRVANVVILVKTQNMQRVFYCIQTLVFVASRKKNFYASVFANFFRNTPKCSLCSGLMLFEIRMLLWVLLFFDSFFQFSRVLFCGKDERNAVKSCVKSFLYVAMHLKKCLFLSNRSLNCFALSPHQTKPPALLLRMFADQIFVLLRLATGKKGKLKNGLNLKSHVESPRDMWKAIEK